MASYSALIAPIRNIGTSRLAITQTSGQWFDSLPDICARFRRITSPHIVIDATGGFISADFVIEPEDAVTYLAHIRKNATTWLFDGQTPIFYGQLDSATTQNDGSVLVAVNGFWQVATAARMREVWDDWDATRLKPAPVNLRSASITTNSDGTIHLSFPNGTVVTNSDKAAVDYYLFGEAAGSRDNKQITGFDVDIAAASYGQFQFAVYGKPSPTSGSSDTLLTTTSTGTFKQGAVADSWPSATGYRCLRFSFTCVTGTTTTSDHYVQLDRVRVSTRESSFHAFSTAGIDSALIARDVFNQKAEALDRYDIPLDFWRQEDGTGRFIYGANGTYADASQAGDPVTGQGTCLNSGVKLTGFNIVDWTAPTDILTTLAQFDGSQVGFYFPVNQRTGYFLGGPGDRPGAGGFYPSQWLSAPPMLTYKPWSALTSPDYYVSLEEGATLVPDPNEQPLLNAEYVNYQTLQGFSASVVTEDTTLGSPTYAAYNDWLTANGYRRAEDYTIQPSIGTTDGSNASTAASIGTQLIGLRNRPSAAGQITIEKNATSRYPIIDGNGAVPPKLALLRPGVYRVVDAPTTKATAVGRATHIEWWGETLTKPETVQITLAQPGQLPWARRLAQLQWRSDHTFIKKK